MSDKPMTFEQAFKAWFEAFDCSRLYESGGYGETQLKAFGAGWNAAIAQQDERIKAVRDSERALREQLLFDAHHNFNNRITEMKDENRLEKAALIKAMRAEYNRLLQIHRNNQVIAETATSYALAGMFAFSPDIDYLAEHDKQIVAEATRELDNVIPKQQKLIDELQVNLSTAHDTIARLRTLFADVAVPLEVIAGQLRMGQFKEFSSELSDASLEAVKKLREEAERFANYLAATAPAKQEEGK